MKFSLTFAIPKKGAVLSNATLAQLVEQLICNQFSRNTSSSNTLKIKNL
jgi:hypothetical protein